MSSIGKKMKREKSQRAAWEEIDKMLEREQAHRIKIYGNVVAFKSKKEKRGPPPCVVEREEIEELKREQARSKKLYGTGPSPACQIM